MNFLIVLALSIPLLAHAPLTAPKATTAIPKRAAKHYTIGQFMATTSYGGADFSADESKILLHSNQSGIFNAYTVDVRGGALRPLTDSDKNSTFAVAFFPEDDRVLVTRDQDGNELNHLYLRELDGSLKDLTPGDKLKGEFQGWSQDRRAFFVTTNERDPRYSDLYRFEVRDLNRKMVFKNEGYSLGGVSLDGKWLSLNKLNTTSDSDCKSAT